MVRLVGSYEEKVWSVHRLMRSRLGRHERRREINKRLDERVPSSGDILGQMGMNFATAGNILQTTLIRTKNLRVQVKDKKQKRNNIRHERANGLIKFSLYNLSDKSNNIENHELKKPNTTFSLIEFPRNKTNQHSKFQKDPSPPSPGRPQSTSEHDEKTARTRSRLPRTNRSRSNHGQTTPRRMSPLSPDDQCQVVG